MLCKKLYSLLPIFLLFIFIVIPSFEILSATNTNITTEVSVYEGEVMCFECVENKNKINQKKHRISFEEAKTAFLDENALVIYDPDHSKVEDRFILLGMSYQLRILVTCYCYRKNDEVIRILSSRKANKNERKQYKGRLL